MDLRDLDSLRPNNALPEETTGEATLESNFSSNLVISPTVPELQNTDAKLIASNDHDQPKNYQYAPLESSSSIRLAKVLPGDASELIRVEIRHARLSDLSQCSAVSYEWGANTREHEVFCQGKSLKVASNLFILLKKFREQNITQFLWIDAICINQDDLEERSQQVSLMTDIYSKASRVILWIGDEISTTGEACKILPYFAEAYQWIVHNGGKSLQGWEVGIFEEPTTIPGWYVCGERLDYLTKTQWEGVTDLISSRSYFARLWVIQEIVLSPRAVILCGGYFISWGMLYKAAQVVRWCKFLHHHIKDPKIQWQVIIIGLTKMNAPMPRLSFLPNNFEAAVCTDPRDRVYGILGVLEPGPLKSSIHPDYSLSFQEVYENTMESIIIHEQALDFWALFAEEPGLRLEDIPSWALDFRSYQGWLHLEKVDWIRDNVCTEIPLTISKRILTVQGIFLDVVQNVCENISWANLKDVILTTLFALLNECECANSFDAEKIARQTLLLIDSSAGKTRPDEKTFFSLISQWALDELGLSLQLTETDISLKSLASNRPLINQLFQDEVLQDIPVKIFVSENPLIKWMLHQAVIMDVTLAENEILLMFSRTEKNLGRNMFIGSKGYQGLGPAGRINSMDIITPAVQAGDRITLVARAYWPIILRPTDDEHYILVGPAHISNLLDIYMPDGWEAARVDNLEPILIR